MANATREILKKEAEMPEGVERTRPRKAYSPNVDILEKKDEIVVTADLPGVDEKSLDITLEKNVLTIHGMTEPEPETAARPLYAEYGVGDFQRAFTISEEIDRDTIRATMKNGVLRLVLPKSQATKTRKIDVSPGS